MTKRKRKSNGLADTDSTIYDEPKRSRTDKQPPKHSVSHGGRVDPTSGQRSAIPGLDDENEDSDLEYGEEMEDALSYLRAVR
jgi:hypothetical protein